MMPSDRVTKRPDQLNIRISDLGKDLVVRLAEHYGLSQAGVLEMIIREKAREIGMLVGPAKIERPDTLPYKGDPKKP